MLITAAWFIYFHDPHFLEKETDTEWLTHTQEESGGVQVQAMVCCQNLRS